MNERGMTDRDRTLDNEITTWIMEELKSLRSEVYKLREVGAAAVVMLKDEELHGEANTMYVAKAVRKWKGEE